MKGALNPLRLPSSPEGSTIPLIAMATTEGMTDRTMSADESRNADCAVATGGRRKVTSPTAVATQKPEKELLPFLLAAKVFMTHPPRGDPQPRGLNALFSTESIHKIQIPAAFANRIKTRADLKMKSGS